MLPTPTFNCCVVGFDVFEQPVSIHLGAAAEHRGLTSLTSSNSILMADQSHCCLIISSTALNDIQNCPSFRSVTRCRAVVSDSNFKFNNNQNIWCGDGGGEVKAGFLVRLPSCCSLAVSLPDTHCRCCTEPETTGDAYKWTYVLFVSQQVWGEKCVLVAKNGTVSEHTDLLFTGSWLTWAHRLMVTPDLMGLKSQSTLYLTWLHSIVFENFKATFAKKFDKEYYFRDKNVPKANG